MRVRLRIRRRQRPGRPGSPAPGLSSMLATHAGETVADLGQGEHSSDRRGGLAGVAGELGGLLKRHWRWWLPPMLLVILLVVLLAVLDPTPDGPFVYQVL